MTKWRLLATLFFASLSVCVGFTQAADASDEQISVRILELNNITKPEKIPVISGVAVDSTGKMLATVGDDHLLRIWNLDDGSVLYRLAAHRDWIKTVCFRPDGKALATAGDDRRIRIWEITALTMPRELPEQPQAIHALVYSPNGELLASAGFDDKVRLYTSDGRLPRELDGPGSDLAPWPFRPMERNWPPRGARARFVSGTWPPAPDRRIFKPLPGAFAPWPIRPAAVNWPPRDISSRSC